jgi:hypothetical protein
MSRFCWGLLLWSCLCLNGLAHEVIVNGEQGRPLVKLTLLPEWTALASREGLELTSPSSRLHCLELRSCQSVEEARVFLKTLRDTIYQSYQELSSEPVQLGGLAGVRWRATGYSRGYETTQDAIVLRTQEGTFCMVILSQDVGYEDDILPALTELVTIP